jgi:hypothetical protein
MSACFYTYVLNRSCFLAKHFVIFCCLDCKSKVAVVTCLYISYLMENPFPKFTKTVSNQFELKKLFFAFKWIVTEN